jgi:hypothetical protein
VAPRFLEFFAATIRNRNTRMAYYRACCRLFEWCDEHRIGQVADIEPLYVAAIVGFRHLIDQRHAFAFARISAVVALRTASAPWRAARLTHGEGRYHA